MKSSYIFLVLILGFYGSNMSAQNLKLHNLFTDNMVMQRDMDCKIWGQAQPESKITVLLNNQSYSGYCEPDGDWSILLPSFPAGGPFDLKVQSKNETVELKNIYFGDVWIASGQSNMEWSIEQGINNQEEEIKNADFPLIRYFDLPRTEAQFPKEDITNGEWVVCTPENAPGFSAVAYFFARKIHKEIDIPIGIISSNWGGTIIEAWTSSTGLNNIPNHIQPWMKKIFDRFPDWGKKAEENSTSDSIRYDMCRNSMVGIDSGVTQIDYKDAHWKTITPPLWDESVLTRQDLLWLRKKITIPEKDFHKEFELSLADPRWYLKLYVNGNQIAEGEDFHCNVKIPKGILRPGKNIIAMRLVNPWWFPNINGEADKMYLKTADSSFYVSLANEWKYSAEIEPKMPELFEFNNLPSSLFNGMIHPLKNFAIKGVIWYQGESNYFNSKQYKLLFPNMISDWRIHWRQGYFPFLFVQLANFGDPVELPQSENDWALIREAQLRTLSWPQTGMASAIDIGDASNIHPANKQDVGLRLALNALAKVYGQDVVYSGPIYEKMEIMGDQIILRFNHIGSGLAIKNNQALKGFAIAGEDKKFYKAAAKIENNQVIVQSDKVKNPVAVRYAWGKNPVNNLCNKEGLPASPFRTDTWDEITVEE